MSWSDTAGRIAWTAAAAAGFYLLQTRLFRFDPLSGRQWAVVLDALGRGWMPDQLDDVAFLCSFPAALALIVAILLFAPGRLLVAGSGQLAAVARDQALPALGALVRAALAWRAARKARSAAAAPDESPPGARPGDATRAAAGAEPGPAGDPEPDLSPEEVADALEAAARRLRGEGAPPADAGAPAAPDSDISLLERRLTALGWHCRPGVTLADGTAVDLLAIAESEVLIVLRFAEPGRWTIEGLAMDPWRRLAADGSTEVEVASPFAAAALARRTVTEALLATIDIAGPFKVGYAIWVERAALELGEETAVDWDRAGTRAILAPAASSNDQTEQLDALEPVTAPSEAVRETVLAALGIA